MAKGNINGTRFVELPCTKDERRRVVVHDASSWADARAVELQMYFGEQGSPTVKVVYLDEQGMRELFNLLGILLHK